MIENENKKKPLSDAKLAALLAGSGDANAQDRLALGFPTAGVAVIAFVLWEAFTERPLLDVRLFRKPQLGMSALAVLILFLATFGAFFLCVQYTAYMFGYEPMKSGLAILPMAAGLVPTSIIGMMAVRKVSIV